MAINPLPLAGVGLAAVAVAGGLYATGTGVADTPPKQTIVTKPGWHSLSEDSDYNTKITNENEGYKDKYGQKYSRFLAGVALTTAQGDKPAHNNDPWWEWVFTNRYETNKGKAKGKFQNLQKTTEGENPLKAACKAAYQANTTTSSGNIKTNEQEVNDNNKFLESNIWLFCSVEGTQPITISEAGDKEGQYDSASYVNTDANKKRLVSTKVEANDWFWKMQEEMFSKLSNNPSLGDSSLFKTLYDNKASSVTPGTTLKVKETCQNAYQETTDKDNKYPKTGVGRFCTLSGDTLS